MIAYLDPQYIKKVVEPNHEKPSTLTSPVSSMGFVFTTNAEKKIHEFFVIPLYDIAQKIA